MQSNNDVFLAARAALLQEVNAYKDEFDALVLADNSVIREVFTRDEVSGRPPLYLFSWLLENSGIIFSEAQLVSGKYINLHIMDTF